MFKRILGIVLVAALGTSASATVYFHRSFDQVLASSEVIIKATVITNLETSDLRKSCVVSVDEVLSGTLTSSRLQINRQFIMMRFPRDNYKTSETLVFCLKPQIQTNRAWPTYATDVPQFALVGSDGEGEFPMTNREVWARDIRSEHAETVRYAGEDLRVRKIPYEEFKKLVKEHQQN